MSKLIVAQSRVSKKIERFIFKSGSFQLGKFAVVYFSNFSKIFKIISVERVTSHFNQNLKGVPRVAFRKFNKNDFIKLEKIESEEKKMFDLIFDKIKKYHYPLKLICVEYTFEFKKIYAYYSSEERINLSILVKKIFESLKVYVEFKHLSRRDISRFMGGFGPCGRNICCNSFLIDLKKVCARSVSSQDLSTDSTKYTGLCGCLMCCLNYEEGMYSEARKTMPQLGEIVNTPNGLASVLGVNVITQVIKVSPIDSPESQNLYFKMSELSKI